MEYQSRFNLEMTRNISPMSLHNNIIAYLTRISGENGTLRATCFMYDSIVGLMHNYTAFSTRMQVYVEVLDENDNTPLTELPVYYPSVPENSPASVSVLQIRAFDRDVSPQQFVFTISSGNPEGYFLINSSTGKSGLYSSYCIDGKIIPVLR